MNRAPIVDVDLNEVVFRNAEILASALFSVTDPDGDTITRYRFLDMNGNASSGFFRLAGADQENGSITEINAGQLASLVYVGGPDVFNEMVRIEAFDGQLWSDPATLGLYTVRENQTRPIASVSSLQILANESRIAADFITASDPDGWPIQKFFLRDRIANKSFFSLDGTTLDQTQYHTIQAADMQRLVFNAAGAGQDIIDVFAWDGTQWSQVASNSIQIRPNNARPTVESVTTRLPERDEVQLADVVQVADADGNSIKVIDLFDTGPHEFTGYLVQDGVGPLAAKKWHRFNFDELDSLSYVGAGREFVEQIRVRVYDGARWSTNQTLFFETVERPKIVRDQLIQRSQLQDIPLADAMEQLSGAPFSTYEIVDTTEVITFEGDISGRFELFDVPYAVNQVHTLTRDEFFDAVFRTGTLERRHLDETYVRAFDGEYWSDWTRLSVRTEPHYRQALKNFLASGEPLSWRQFVGGSDPINITFSFMTDSGGYSALPGIEGPTAVFSQTRRAAVRNVLDNVSEVANVNFIEVADTDFQNGQRGGLLRFTNFFNEDGPFWGAGSPSDPSLPIGGDVWLNIFCSPDACYMSTNDYGLGSVDYNRVLEAVGIAMGMRFHYATYTPPVNIYSLPAATASDDFSVLTREGPRIFGGEWHPDIVQPSSYMLYDIITLQDLYGANMNTRTGDTTYSIASFWSERDDLVYSIWDAGGIDTLTAEGSTLNGVVDLREGSFSTIGIHPGNISIAFGTVIENGLGSSRPDLLIGNDIRNVLDGGKGGDTIWGGAGNDVITGGEGNDRILYGIGDGDDLINEMQLAGRDTLEIRTNFPEMDNFQEDLAFRRQGLDLVVDLTLNGGASQGTMTIKNQRWGSWRVESLEFGSERVDLTAVYDLATNQNQQFRILANSTAFGSLVEAV